MEAVPKLPMLYFDTRLSLHNGNFVARLKELIQLKCNDFGDYSREISELESLRSQACIGPTADVSGISIVKKYFCQLNFLEQRFQLSDLSEFFESTWQPVFETKPTCLDCIAFEKVGVLYNVGALHSLAGALVSRDSSENMKIACTHFQCAAGAFHSIPDRFDEMMNFDISALVLAFYSQVCLAQAQECILEKSIFDHRKSSIVAKVGSQVVDYYQQCFQMLNCPVLMGEDSLINLVSTNVYVRWTQMIEFKISYYLAMSHFYHGISAEESRMMGQRLAFCNAAVSNLEKCEKLSKQFDGDDRNKIKATLNFAKDVFVGKRDIAKKENEFIYNEKVPDIADLPELKGVSLVKGINFDEHDLDVSGRDILERVVPLEAHQNSSIYSEMKDQLMRNLTNELEERNSVLSAFMSSLRLEDIPSASDHLVLPQSLIIAAARLSVKGDASDNLSNAMKDIAGVSADVEACLIHVDNLFKEDELHENEFNIIHHHDDDVSKSKSEEHKKAINELKYELSKYNEAFSMASESNLTLRNAMSLHTDNLRLLSRSSVEEILRQIPSVADLDLTANSSMDEMERIITKVKEMRSQREMLIEAFRERIRSEDITKNIIYMSSKKSDGIDLQETFAQELKKFDQDLKIIHLNFTAQDNILQRLTEVNAEFASTRRLIQGIVLTRSQKISALESSYGAYDDLFGKATQGIEFYKKLLTNVEDMQKRIKTLIENRKRFQDGVFAKNYRSSSNVSMMTPIKLERGSVGAAKPTLKDYLRAMKGDSATFQGIPNTAIVSQSYSSDCIYSASNQTISTNASQLRHEGLSSGQPSNMLLVSSVQGSVGLSPTRIFSQPRQNHVTSFIPTPSVQRPILSVSINPPSTVKYSINTSFPVSVGGSGGHVVLNQQQYDPYLNGGGYVRPSQVPENTFARPTYVSSNLTPLLRCPSLNPTTMPVVTTGSSMSISKHFSPYLPPSSVGSFSMNHSISIPISSSQNQPILSSPFRQLQGHFPCSGGGGFYPVQHNSQNHFSSPANNILDIEKNDQVTLDPPLLPHVVPSPSPVEREQSQREQKKDIDLSPMVISARSDEHVLQPTIITEEALALQKQEAQAADDLFKSMQQDPYMDACLLKQLSSEFELMEKDAEVWIRRVSQAVVASSNPGPISVARCYPMKNRVADVLPFDATRVTLPLTKDDYINASYIKNGLSLHSPRFIATQCPTPTTLNDFWSLIWQEGVETIVSLHKSEDFTSYIPLESSSKPMLVTLATLEITQKANFNETFGENWQRRTYIVRNTSTNTSRDLVHIQCDDFVRMSAKMALDFINELLGRHYLQQRKLSHPILVHCLYGSAPSAGFILLAAAISEINVAVNNPIIPDLVRMSVNLSQCRKGFLLDLEQPFRLVYNSVLCHCELILRRHGLLGVSVSESVTSANVVLSMADFFCGSPSRNKFTKADFRRSSGAVLGSALKKHVVGDPLSELDPLWSLQK